MCSSVSVFEMKSKEPLGASVAGVARREVDAEALPQLVDERLALDSERVVRERDGQIPAGAELVEARGRRFRVHELAEGCEVVERTGGLAAEALDGERQRSEHSPLEHVVEALSTPARG